MFMGLWWGALTVLVVIFSYRYLIPVTERQPEALYAFKSRGFGGEIGLTCSILWLDERGAPEAPCSSITQYQSNLVVERFEYRALVMSSHPVTSPLLPRWKPLAQ